MTQMRTLSPLASEMLVRISRGLQNGTIRLPEHILRQKVNIAAAVRNAELFSERTGEVDRGMVDKVTNLRLELDQMYGQWAEEMAMRFI